MSILTIYALGASGSVTTVSPASVPGFDVLTPNSNTLANVETATLDGNNPAAVVSFLSNNPDTTTVGIYRFPTSGSPHDTILFYFLYKVTQFSSPNGFTMTLAQGPIGTNSNTVVIGIYPNPFGTNFAYANGSMEIDNRTTGLDFTQPITVTLDVTVYSSSSALTSPESPKISNKKIPIIMTPMSGRSIPDMDDTKTL